MLGNTGIQTIINRKCRSRNADDLLEILEFGHCRFAFGLNHIIRYPPTDSRLHKKSTSEIRCIHYTYSKAQKYEGGGVSIIVIQLKIDVIDVLQCNSFIIAN